MEQTQPIVPRNAFNGNQQNASNMFSKAPSSRLQETMNTQNVSSNQDRTYDSQYRSGFPKLYTFDTSTQGKNRFSVDQRGKYSFRNDYSQIVEQNQSLLKENGVLRDQINKLNGLLQQRDAEINALRHRLYVLENQAMQIGEFQQRYIDSQAIINQQNNRISGLTQQLSQYQTQKNQLGAKLSEYEAKISQLQKNMKDSSKSENETNYLKNQVNLLTQKINQYELQIQQYEKTINKYQTQVDKLQDTNWKLEDRINKLKAAPPAPISVVTPVVAPVDNEKFIVQQGKLNFRILILLEEINRLGQRQSELILKAQELHAYLLKAENYIEEIQQQLERNNLKENIPAHIVERITELQQQNSRYTLLVQELQSRLAQNKVNGVSQDEHFFKLAEKDLRIIVLLQEINRLNHKVVEVHQYLQNAQNYIAELQGTIQKKQTIIPPQIQSQIAFLTQENYRLNESVEKYINEIKHLKVSFQPVQPKTVIPPQIQARLALLAQENERLQVEVGKAEFKNILLLEQISRLNHSVQEISSYLVNAQNYIAQLQMRQNELAAQNNPEQLEVYRQEIQKLTQIINDLQRRPPKVETRIEQKIEFRIPAEIQNRIALLASENERLQKELTKRDNEKRNDEHFIVQIAKLQLRCLILLEEINRLNFVNQQIKVHLINAENYIFQIENRPPNLIVPKELEAELAGLRGQNQRLHREINKLSVDYESQIIKYKTQISNINIQIYTYKSRIVELQSQKSAQLNSDDSDYFALWATEHFRVMILLEQINRLNKKVEDVDRERVQVIGHLINAQNVIKELQIKCNNLEASTINSVVSNTTIMQGSNITLEQLNFQLSEAQSRAHFQVAQRDMRIVFLMEQINRLNHKIKQILSESGFEKQILAVQQEKYQVERELESILNHLREAEEYIAALIPERDYLAMQLQRLTQGY